jgi:hypothetical protein
MGRRGRPRRPADQRDVDSTICQVQGHAKGGAAYGYTRVLGYHPLLATRADPGEVVHLRMRKGSANTARGAERFVNETAGRLRRAGATGQLTLRADSGFWSAKVLAACCSHRLRYSITVRHTAPVTAAIAAIPDDAWTDIDYPDGGSAQVAETTLPGPAGGRLIVRRTRLVGPQATLWPDWRYHAFVTDRPGSAVWLDADHRRHATVELAIRDLKQGAGLRHCPSGVFLANAAWAVIAAWRAGGRGDGARLAPRRLVRGQRGAGCFAGGAAGLHHGHDDRDPPVRQGPAAAPAGPGVRVPVDAEQGGARRSRPARGVGRRR